MQPAKSFRLKSGLLFSLVVGLLFSAVLVWHARHYLPFVSDDALISLRYLRRFLQGEGLTWTPGRPVEGYSNLLWILLLAIPGALGADLVTAARVLGTVCALLVIVSLLSWYSRDRTRETRWIALVTGLLFYSLAAPTAVWAIGGLEQPLCACLLSILIPLGFSIIESTELEWKRVFAAAVVLGLLCLTRPDSPIFVGALVLALILGWGISESRRRWRALAVLLAVPLLCYGGQTAFRLYYYGELVTNTALVKFNPSLHHLSEGLKYIWGGLVSLAPFSFIALLYLAASMWSSSARKRSGLLLLFTGLWLVYLAVIGGDIFPAYRLFVPLMPIMTFALVEAVAAIYSLSKTKKILGWLAALAIGFLFVVYGRAQFRNPESIRARTELWEWDGQVLGLFLKKAFAQQQPLVAVTAAGCIPFWSELPSLDMLGLNDYYLPRHPPSDLGEGYLGHELGDGKYVIEQKPDIIVFHAGVKKAVFRSGVEMQKSGDLSRWHAPVNLLATFPYEYRATIWIRQDSEKIGIRRTPEQIDIPGYLLTSNRASVVQFNSEGKLVLPVSSKEPAGIDFPEVSPGEWVCEIVSRKADAAECKVMHAGPTMRVRVTTTSPGPIEVEKLILRKSP
jgi:arabinofuranosyltransferase